jgi:tripartite-type tricarboxylate transporter receptor subunit TctC
LLIASLLPNFTAASEKPGGRSFDEKTVADFYRGKTVTIVVGFAAGGGYDIAARLIAKHIGKQIPGHPGVIVDNRPGGGSLVAANLVYNTLRKDGTFIANFNEQMILQHALGREGIEFDARKYNWLGSIYSGQAACGVHKDTGVSHVNQLMGPTGRRVNMGGESPGSTITDSAAVMRAALGLNFRIIYGYSGGRPIMNSILNRELDGMCISWEAFTSFLRPLFEPARLLNMLVVFGSSVPDHPWLRNAVAAETIAPNRKASNLLKAMYFPQQISHLYAVAPGVPTGRVAALRNAVDSTLADPTFIADHAKTRRDLFPKRGEEVAGIVNDLLSMDQETATALKEALQQRP